jgi:hypothetical protein
VSRRRDKARLVVEVNWAGKRLPEGIVEGSNSRGLRAEGVLRSAALREKRHSSTRARARVDSPPSDSKPRQGRCREAERRGAFRDLQQRW